MDFFVSWGRQDIKRPGLDGETRLSRPFEPRRFVSFDFFPIIWDSSWCWGCVFRRKLERAFPHKERGVAGKKRFARHGNLLNDHTSMEISALIPNAANKHLTE